MNALAQKEPMSVDAMCDVIDKGIARIAEQDQRIEELTARAEELDEILGDLLRDHSEREAIGGGPGWRERHAKTWARAWEVYGEERGV